MKRKLWTKGCALVLTGALAIGGAVTALAGRNERTLSCSLSGKLLAETAREGGHTSPSGSSEAKGKLSMEKEETVYVLSNADGSPSKVIVSDWLKNPLGQDRIADKSSLSEIKNVKGEEAFTKGEKDALTWEAGGQDIYYQGISDKTLPIGVSIEYRLDGKEVTPEELKGKSGIVSITLHYENQQKETVLVDGREEELYVPFAVVSGTILSNDSFRNITVSNGKIINDGDKTVVMGFALPGLQENLQISRDKFEIPDQVEITADVENFSIETILTVATNEMLQGVELSEGGDLEELKSSLDKLSEAASQLMDGSSALYDGLSTLLSKSDEMIAGVSQLSDGSEKLLEGAGELSEGTGSLSGGAAALTEGLKTLSGNSEALRAGAKTVFQSLLKTVEDQLQAAGLAVPELTIENYGSVLNQLIGSMTEDQVRALAYQTALEQVTEAVHGKQAEVEAGVTAVVKENVTAQVRAQAIPAMTAQATGQSLTPEQYDAAVLAGQIPAQLQAAVNGTVEQNVRAQMESDEVKGVIASNTQAQMQTLIEENMNSKEVQGRIEAAVDQAAAGSGQIQTAKGQLDSYREFYEGLNAYTMGVDQAYGGSRELNEGASQLAKGAAQLFAGSKSLRDGLKTLESGTKALKAGVTELTDGASRLSDGCRQFYEEGIQKLLEVMDGDVGQLIKRLQATIEASQGYDNFSGIDDGMDGTVRFIYRTEGIRGE